MKKETLKEAVDHYFKLSHSRLMNEQQKENEREIFFAGAKCAQERMYSEEELLNKFEAWNRTYGVITIKDIKTIFQSLSTTTPKLEGVDLLPELANKDEEVEQLAKKLTAIEWLIEQCPRIETIVAYSILEQAKEMFEQQIIDACNQTDFFGDDSRLPGQQYYDETFKAK